MCVMFRLRCIRKSHESKPNALCYLPSSSTKGQQIATGSEDGEVSCNNIFFTLNATIV